MRVRIDRLIKFLEKTLSLDVTYFLKNHFYLSLATTINIISGFILSLLYARFLDKTTYGQYVLIFSFISTLSFTRLTGLQSIFPYAITAGNEGFYPKVEKISFITSIFGSLILLGLTGYYSLPGKPLLAPSLLLTAILFPFINSLFYYTAFLPTKKMFKITSLYSIIQAIIPNFAIAITIIFLPKTFWLVLAALVPQAVLNVYFTFKTIGKLQNHNESPEDFRYGIKLSLIYLPSMIIQNLDNILLAKLLGFEKLAIYSFASTIPKQVSPFLKNLEILAIPKLGEISKDILSRDIPKKISQLILLTSVIVGFYILTVPFLFKILYPQYLQSILPSQIYSLSLIFFPYFLISQSFHRLRLFSHTLVFNWSIVIAKLVLLLIFIPRYGIVGAALATVSLEIFKLLLAFAMLKTVKSR